MTMLGFHSLLMKHKVEKSRYSVLWKCLNGWIYVFEVYHVFTVNPFNPGQWATWAVLAKTPGHVKLLQLTHRTRHTMKEWGAGGAANSITVTLLTDTQAHVILREIPCRLLRPLKYFSHPLGRPQRFFFSSSLYWSFNCHMKGFPYLGEPCQAINTLKYAF